MKCTHHEREEQGDGFDGLEEPHDCHGEDLDGGEDVDALDAHVTQEDVVRLVLLRTEDDQDSLHKLQTQKIHVWFTVYNVRIHLNLPIAMSNPNI